MGGDEVVVIEKGKFTATVKGVWYKWCSGSDLQFIW